MKWGLLLMVYGAVSLVGNPPAALTQVFQQKEVIAACLILEAGGEGERGMQAVMNVIANRAEGNPSEFYAQTIAPHQFAGFGGARGLFFRDFTPLVERAKRSSSWPVAKALVEKAFRNELPDITGGATHFYAHKSGTPVWAKAFKKSVVIGNHTFMKEHEAATK